MDNKKTLLIVAALVLAFIAGAFCYHIFSYKNSRNDFHRHDWHKRGFMSENRGDGCGMNYDYSFEKKQERQGSLMPCCLERHGNDSIPGEGIGYGGKMKYLENQGCQHGELQNKSLENNKSFDFSASPPRGCGMSSVLKKE